VSGGPSAVVLSAPPDDFGGFGYINGLSYSFLAVSADLQLGGQTPAITMPGSAILLARPVEISGTQYLFVGTVSASGVFSLYRLHDSTGDDIIDGSTQTLMVTSGTSELYGTWIEQSGTNFYLLDRRCQDIRLLKDTTSDGFPDTLEATPFAKSDDYSRLLEVQAFSAESAGVLVAVDDLPASFQVLETEEQERVRYSDTDLDGDVDTEVIVAPKSRIPAVWGSPFDGQTTLRVRAEYPDARTVQIWSLDGSGNELSVLGSAVLSTSDWTNIAVSPALSENDEIHVRFSTSPTTDIFRALVENDSPQVLHIDESIYPLSQTTSVTVSGYNFTANTDAKLETSDGTTHTLTASLVSTEEVTVTIPSLTSAALGGADLIIEESGAEVRNFRVLVCPAP